MGAWVLYEQGDLCGLHFLKAWKDLNETEKDILLTYF